MPPGPPTPSTRVLGVDFGTRRVGLAISDPGRSIATPLEVYHRRDLAQDARYFARIVADHDVDLIVVGLPLHTSGNESESSKLARRWAAWLGEVTDRPVSFHDERYTSVEADELLRSVGMKLRDRQARRDMLAARSLLQGYLEAGCPRVEPPGASIDG